MRMNYCSYNKAMCQRRKWRKPTGRRTQNLRGRTQAPQGDEGAQFPSARGTKPLTHHGPLQRLLDGNDVGVTVLFRSDNNAARPSNSIGTWHKNMAMPRSKRVDVIEEPIKFGKYQVIQQIRPSETPRKYRARLQCLTRRNAHATKTMAIANWAALTISTTRASSACVK